MWLLTLIIWAATAAQLRGLGPPLATAAGGCYFGRAYLCDLAIASGVVGWVFTTAIAAAWGVGLTMAATAAAAAAAAAGDGGVRRRCCGCVPPPRGVEAAGWTAWAIWWAVVAAAMLVVPSGGLRRSAGEAAKVFVCLLVPLCAARADAV
ncbi:hypothetical protein MMPV_009571 [Pyropia vietnamensis]